MYIFFPFQKFGYVFIWTVLYIISSIISFVTFQLNAILVYILLALFVMDLFFHYRVYKTGSGPDATASNPTATAASGGVGSARPVDSRHSFSYAMTCYSCVCSSTSMQQQYGTNLPQSTDSRHPFLCTVDHRRLKIFQKQNLYYF